MSTEQIIRNLRGMLHRENITQHEVDVICAAIRALGGNRDQFVAANAAATAAPFPEGWRPIAEADKEAELLLLTNGVIVTCGGWVSDADHGADWEGQLGAAGWWSIDAKDGFKPTHFMPLPSPPEGAR